MIGLLASLTSAILALVFLFAGLGKLLNPARTRRAVVDLGAPPTMALFFGTLLPIAELATGAFLVIPGLRWYGGAAAVVLLAIFLTAMAKAYRDGVTADCGCFGRETRSGVNASALMRNVGFIVLGVVVLLASPSPMDIGAGGVSAPLIIAVVASLCTLALLRREVVAHPDVDGHDGLHSPFQWPLENPDSSDESRATAAK